MSFTNQDLCKLLRKHYSQTCKKQGKEPNSSIKTSFQRILNGCLDLSSVYLCSEQCEVMATVLAKCSGLAEIRMSDCLIGDQGLSLLVRGLENITVINLKGNELIESGHQLGTFLKTNGTLTHLNLEWNRIGSSEASLAALAEGVAISPSLVYLNLSNNQISHCGASFISSALSTNRALIELDLRWNNIGILGGRQLLLSLKLNACLEELHLTGNNITTDLTEAIASMLSAKSRHYQAEKEWSIHKDMLQTRNKLKEEENAHKVSCLYDQLDEMRVSSLGIAERAREELISHKAEIESCYAKITFLEDQLLMAKSALELSEEKYAHLQEEHDLALEKKDRNLSEMSDQLNTKNQETQSLKERIKHLEDELIDVQHNLGQKVKISTIEKLNSEELVKNLTEELDKIKRSQTIKVKELEAQLEDALKMKMEQLQKTREAHDQELLQNQTIWDKEKAALTEQLQSSATRLKQLQQEYSEFSIQTKIDKNDLAERMEKLKQDLQTKQSIQLVELNQRKAEFQQRLEVNQLELNDASLKIKKLQLEKDLIEEQLKQKESKFSQAIKINDEQQNKMLAMMNKHSIESEELRQQRNRFEQLYEEHKQLLHTAKEESHKLRSDLQEVAKEQEREQSRLKQTLENTKQQLILFKQQEAERTSHLRSALETYMLGIDK